MPKTRNRYNKNRFYKVGYYLFLLYLLYITTFPSYLFASEKENIEIISQEHQSILEEKDAGKKLLENKKEPEKSIDGWSVDSVDFQDRGDDGFKGEVKVKKDWGNKISTIHGVGVENEEKAGIVGAEYGITKHVSLRGEEKLKENDRPESSVMLKFKKKF